MRPRLLAPLGLFLALSGGFAAAAPAPAAEPRRAAIVFLPAEDEQRSALLEAFGRREMAVGLVSPSVGGYDPNQTVLDISQGTRIATGLYPSAPPRLSVAPRGALEGEEGAYVNDRVRGWSAAVRRARAAPGEVVPGLLGAAVGTGNALYVGGRGANAEAAVAADRDGEVAAAAAADPPGAVGAWPSFRLLVIRADSSGQGLVALDGLLRSRRANDLVIAMRAPPPGPELRLLPAAALGPGIPAGVLRSATTRRAGLVTATDLAPSVLRALGRRVPAAIEGQPLASRPGDGAATARDLAARLDVILERRPVALPAVLMAWGLALAALAAVGRARTGLRLGLLTALWMPGTALLPAALAPSAVVEALVLALGSLGLAVATDRLLRWPLAPALPAAAVLLAYTIDLAAGSAFTPLALTGSNPRGGARFFGVGNELETLLTVTILLGTGAAVSVTARRRAILAFALTGLFGAIVMGAGRLGADVGAVIALGAGAAAAVLACLPPGRARRRGAVLALLVPLLALAGLFALDVLTGGGAHLSRSVVEADSLAGLGDVAERRIRLSLTGLTAPGTLIAVLAAVIVLALGVVRRRRILAPLAGGAPGFTAGVIGAFAAVVVGALANDSGPLILILGTVFLGFAAAYACGRPHEESLPERDRRHTEQPDAGFVG